MIVVIGGTGSLAGAATQLLLARGHEVRVLTRTPDKVSELREQGAEIVPGDLRDKESLVRACAGMEKVLTAAHSIFGRGPEASKYVDLQGHLDLIDAAEGAGVGHFVYTSVYAHGPQYAENYFFKIHRQVERYLEQSGLDYTILCPTAFMEFHVETLIGQPILEKGTVTLFGKGENPRNFVAVDDVARIAVAALEDDAFKGRIVNIGGPDNLTNMDVVGLYEQLAGRPAKVRHVPLMALRVMWPLLRPIHPGLSQVMHSEICADTADCTFDCGPLEEMYGLELTHLADWVETRERVSA